MSFYKQQVDDINKKTDIPYPDEKGSDEKEPGGDSSLSTRTIIEIVMGVVIAIAVVIIILFVIRWKRMRKKRASELSAPMTRFLRIKKDWTVQIQSFFVK